MATIKVLGTGSSGNSYVIIDGAGNCLVVEAWLNYSSVIANTKEAKEYCGYIVSHKHSDHFVFTVAKQYEIFFGKQVTEFDVYSFPVYHDYHAKILRDNASTCNGFIIQTKCKKTILYATDFYHIDDEVIDQLRHYNFDSIMIECSYNNFIFKDLDEDKKERLRNHCSDDKCVNYVSRIAHNKTTQIITLHKSESGARAGMILAKFARAGFNRVRVAVKGTEVVL